MLDAFSSERVFCVKKQLVKCKLTKTQSTMEREVLGMSQTRSRMFPPAMRRSGTDLGRRGCKWDGLRAGWDGSRMNCGEAQVEVLLKSCPETPIGVPFSLKPVPDASQISLSVSYFSIKWDKWDVNLRRGDRGKVWIGVGFT